MMHRLNGFKQSNQCRFAEYYVSLVKDANFWRETVTKLKYCIDTKNGTSFSLYKDNIKKLYDEHKANGYG